MSCAMDLVMGKIQSSVWGEFPNTVLHFRSDPPLDVDLRAPVTRDCKKRLLSLGLEQTFGVITAQDPGGTRHSSEQNATLAMNLQHALDAAGTPYVLLDACNHDRSHCEVSVAVSLPRAQVTEIARGYDQLAIFWFDSHRFWIVPVLSEGPAIPLPVTVLPSHVSS